jgi:hypothetical protein
MISNNKMTDGEFNERINNDTFDMDSLGLHIIKYANFSIYILICIFTSYAVLLLTRSFIMAGLAPYLFLLYPANVQVMINSITPELLGTLLITILSVTSLKFIRTNRMFYLLCASMVSGMLTLIKAHFEFLLLINVVLLILSFNKLGINRSHRKNYLMLHVLTIILVVSPWIVRNYINFHKIMISERGGIILAYRVEYNRMNLKEFVFSIPYFFDFKPYINAVLSSGFITEIDVARLERTNPKGFYQTARTRRSNYMRIYNDSTVADGMLKKDCIVDIIRSMPKHILTTIPLFFSGTSLQFENEDAWILPKKLAYFFGLVMLYPVFFLSVRKGHFDKAGFFLPALYNISFMSFLTHNIPRYNRLLFPFILIIFMLIFHKIVTKLCKINFPNAQ